MRRVFLELESGFNTESDKAREAMSVRSNDGTFNGGVP